MKKLMSIAVLTLLVSALGTLADDSSPVVETSLGSVQGTLDENIRVFRGIPYAEPPVGSLRWRATQPKTAWEGVLDATDYGPICPQPSANMQGQDEDCLTLNVWTPQDIEEPLPVMVWIHGGAQVVGSGEIDGQTFAKDGVVLVSINYRLGKLGVFAHPELTASLGEGESTGFLLLSDQIEALRWVQREIAEFGGDPNQVTIFGVSAGGTNVNLLMTSPRSKGLFHGAIAQSGANGLSSFRSVADAEQHGVAYMEASGSENLDDLRTKTWREITMGPPGFQYSYGEVIDGITIKESVTDAFTNGRQHNVPYIAGANSYEGSLKAVIPIPAFDAALNANREEIAAAYGLEPEDPFLSLAFYGDSLFGAPTRFLVAQMKNVAAPGWLYHFDYVMESMNEHVPGASHGSEVLFVFETIESVEIPPQVSAFTGIPTGVYEPSEKDLDAARMVHHYWVEFAKSLNPNGEDLPAWPDYKGTDPATLLMSNEGFAPKTNLHEQRLDLIENAFFEAQG